MKQNELDRFLEQDVQRIIFSDNPRKNTLAKKMLYKAGVDTVRDALKISAEKLLSLGGSTSYGSLNTIEDYLLQHDLWLGMNIEHKAVSEGDVYSLSTPIEAVLGYTLEQQDITDRQRDVLQTLTEMNIKTAGQLVTLSREEFKDIFPPTKFNSVRRTFEDGLSKYGLQLFQRFSDSDDETFTEAVKPSPEVKEVIQRQKDVLDVKRAFSRAFSGDEWREHIPAIVSNAYAMEAVKLYLAHEAAAMSVLEQSLGERVKAFAATKLESIENIKITEQRIIDAFQVTGKALRRHFQYVTGAKSNPQVIRKKFSLIMQDGPTIDAIEKFDQTMRPHKQTLARFLPS